MEDLISSQEEVDTFNIHFVCHSEVISLYITILVSILNTWFTGA